MEEILSSHLLSTQEVNCKICSNKSNFIFDLVILNQHKVKYFQCCHCDFVQTSEVFWLDQAYSQNISEFDTGIARRNLKVAIHLNALLNHLKNRGQFLDWAGGTGLLVRLMRDMGYDFYFYDKYERNVFAPGYDVINLKERPRVVCLIEVMEHLENPKDTLNEIIKFSPDLIVMTQELLPESITTDWWYLAPFAGQHISFYSEKTFRHLAELFEMSYFRIGNFHLLSRGRPFSRIRYIALKIVFRLSLVFGGKLLKGNGFQADFNSRVRKNSLEANG